MNSVSAGVIGTLLLIAYAATRTKKGSLSRKARFKREADASSSLSMLSTKAQTQGGNKSSFSFIILLMDQRPIIEFYDFTFQYFSQAEPTLHDIHLKIYPGEKILIVGPSGSGKSTLGHCLNGLIPFSYKGRFKAA